MSLCLIYDLCSGRVEGKDNARYVALDCRQGLAISHIASVLSRFVRDESVVDGTEVLFGLWGEDNSL